MTDKIQGGYILLARNIIESEIWQKPAEYLKIWIYILCRVQWKQSKKTKIGENFFNFSKEEIPGVTRFQVYEFLRWAKTLSPTDSTTQLTTEKTTRGTRLKVTKYTYYQDPNNYVHQHTSQQLHQQVPNTISKTLNKNIKSIDIYNTHTKEKSVCEKISSEDMKILRKYAKENGARNIKPYVNKLIENGGYIDILKEEKSRMEKEKQRAQRYEIKSEVPPEKFETKEETEAARRAYLEATKNLRRRKLDG